MSLKPIDYVNGISSLIYTSILIIIGITIILTYIKLKERTFLFIGLALVGLSEPWIPSGVSFLWNVITGEGLSLEIYVIIGNIFIPISILCWLVGFTDLITPEKQKQILLIYVIIGILFEVIFFILLFVNPSLIGVFSVESATVHIDIEYRTFILGYLLFIILTVLITGIVFGRTSIMTDDRIVKLKGKFLIIAVVSWVIGAVLDTSIPLNLITLPFTRLLLIISAFLYYFGFIMPPKIKEILLK
jgi:hypothetical protein